MIGQEVRRRREDLGLTGAQLAARSGLSPGAVSQIENGKRTPSATTVMKLAQGLGVDVGELFPKAQAPLPLDLGWRRGGADDPDELEEQRCYASALKPLAVCIRALVETFGPILDALAEPPALEEYPRVRPLFKAAAEINKTLTESGFVGASNEFLAESKRGGPGARDLGRRVRAFQTAVVELNEQAERAREWALRVPEIAELRERGLRDEDLERELRGILAAEEREHLA